MDRNTRPPDSHDDGDLLDRFPRFERATTRLERSFGPSCLLSMVITVLFLLLLKRYLRLSWAGMGIMSLVIWFGVLALLVRWRPETVVDEEE